MHFQLADIQLAKSVASYLATTLMVQFPIWYASHQNHLLQL